jgi:hypothetical protein
VKTFILTLVVGLFMVVGAQAQNSSPEGSRTLSESELQKAIAKYEHAGREFSPEYLDLQNGIEVSPMLVQGCGDWTTRSSYFCGDNICLDQYQVCGLGTQPDGGPFYINGRVIKVFLE